MNVRKILIIRTRMIGDVLLDTPLVRCLKEKLPGVEIHYLTSKVASPVLVYNTNIEAVYEKELWGMWELASFIFRKKFDAVFDLMHNAWSMFLTLVSRAPVRSVINKGRFDPIYNFKVRPPFREKPYTVWHRLEFLRPLGIEPEGCSVFPEFPYPDFYVDEMRKRLREMGIQDSDFLVVINTAPESPVRNWPLDRFVEIADALIEEFGAKVVFAWTPEKKELLKSALRGSRKGAILAPATETLYHLAALLKLSKLYFGTDSGPRHIAISQGTPTFAIFTHADPSNWTPPNSPQHGYIWKGLPCQPCYRTKCKLGNYNCLLSLSREEVQNALFEFIERKVLA